MSNNTVGVNPEVFVEEVTFDDISGPCPQKHLNEINGQGSNFQTSEIFEKIVNPFAEDNAELPPFHGVPSLFMLVMTEDPPPPITHDSGVCDKNNDKDTACDHQQYECIVSHESCPWIQNEVGVMTCIIDATCYRKTIAYQLYHSLSR